MRVIQFSLIAVGAMMLVVVPTTIWALRRAEARGVAAVFNGMTAITFTQPTFNAPAITVTEPKEVQRIIGTLHLTPAPSPCGIKPLHIAIFKKGTQQMEVMFCRCHFLPWGVKGLDASTAPWGYLMPEEFYSEFSKLIRDRTNEPWIRP